MPEPVDHFPTLDWPAPIGEILGSVAVSKSVHEDMAATIALPILAAAIGRSRSCRPKDDWSEEPVIWSAVIAPPAAGKSPTQNALEKPLEKVQRDLGAEYKRLLALHDAEPDTPKPPRRQVIVRDATIEALAHVLRASPRGVLLTRDELAAWFHALNQYKSSGADREHWLELWGGKDLTINRVRFDDGPLEVVHPHVSVVGGIQPSKVKVILDGAGDGLPSRFLLSAPPAVPPNESSPAVPDRLTKTWESIVTGLHGLAMGPDGAWPYEWESGARESMAACRQELANEQIGLSEELQAVWGKAKAYLARIAVVIAACHEVIDERAVITHDTVDVAYRTCRFFLTEAQRVYEGDVLPSGEDFARLGPTQYRELAQLLEAKGGECTAREVMRARRPFRDATAAEVTNFLQDAAAKGFVRLVKGERRALTVQLARTGDDDSEPIGDDYEEMGEDPE